MSRITLKNVILFFAATLEIAVIILFGIGEVPVLSLISTSVVCTLTVLAIKLSK